jgi:hypothetical protein
VSWTPGYFPVEARIAERRLTTPYANVVAAREEAGETVLFEFVQAGAVACGRAAMRSCLPSSMTAETVLVATPLGQVVGAMSPRFALQAVKSVQSSMQAEAQSPLPPEHHRQLRGTERRPMQLRHLKGVRPAVMHLGRCGCLCLATADAAVRPWLVRVVHERGVCAGPRGEVGLPVLGPAVPDRLFHDGEFVR